MLKQILILVALSLAITLSMAYTQQAVQLLITAHDWIANLLTDIFTGGQAGNMMRGLIALLTIPLLIALIPTLIYWALRRHWFPYFMEIVWVVWLIQAGALLVTYNAIV